MRVCGNVTHICLAARFTRMKYTPHSGCGAHSDACYRMHRTETGLLHYLFTLLILTTKFIVLKSKIAHILVRYSLFYAMKRQKMHKRMYGSDATAHNSMHSLMKLLCLHLLLVLCVLSCMEIKGSYDVNNVCRWCTLLYAGVCVCKRINYKVNSTGNEIYAWLYGTQHHNKSHNSEWKLAYKPQHIRSLKYLNS